MHCSHLLSNKFSPPVLHPNADFEKRFPRLGGGANFSLFPRAPVTGFNFNLTSAGFKCHVEAITSIVRRQ